MFYFIFLFFMRHLFVVIQSLHNKIGIKLKYSIVSWWVCTDGRMGAVLRETAGSPKLLVVVVIHGMGWLSPTTQVK